MAKKKKVVAAELLNQAPVVEFEAEPEPKPVTKGDNHGQDAKQNANQDASRNGEGFP
jgi:hypothetical protein